MLLLVYNQAHILFKNSYMQTYTQDNFRVHKLILPDWLLCLELLLQSSGLMIYC